jgi:CysZ protein
VARKDGRPGLLSEFYSGVGMLGRGFRVWGTAPKLMWLGLVPALIVAAIFVVGIVVLAINLESLAALATPFASEWDPVLRDAFRLLVILAFFVLAVIIVIYTFTAFTLAVGDSFYERIWRHVESKLGCAPTAPEIGVWREIRRAIGDGLRLLIPTVFFALLLFGFGLIPVVGQVSAAVLGAFIGGWFLTVELSGHAFEARGITLSQRRRILGSRRAMTMGFGVATWLLFLVPFGAVIAMPAAVAGATMLSRRILDDAARTPVTV